MSSIKDNLQQHQHRKPARTTLPHIKMNGATLDPVYILNGVGPTATFFHNSIALMFSVSDPAYIGSEILRPGANLGKNAAGQIMRFMPSQADNTSIYGSDGSMPVVGPTGGWEMNTFANGTIAVSNWLISLILVNPSTATYAVLPGIRMWLDDSMMNIFAQGQSLVMPQYAADSFVTGGVAQSQAFQFSVSVSGKGAGGILVLSQTVVFEEFLVKITSASSKSGSKVEIRTNG